MNADARADTPDVEALVGLVQALGEAMAAAGATVSDVAASVPGVVDDQDTPLGLQVGNVEVAGIDAVHLTRRWETDEPNAAEVRLAAPVDVSELTPYLGESRPVPPSGHGSPRVVFGPDAEYAHAWTVFGDLDGATVTALTVRRDS